jgi:hypothetical protein
MGMRYQVATAKSRWYATDSDNETATDVSRRQHQVNQVILFFASGGFFAKYFLMPVNIASAIWS